MLSPFPLLHPSNNNYCSFPAIFFLIFSPCLTFIFFSFRTPRRCRRRAYTSRFKERRTTLTSIGSALASRCCSRECMFQFTARELQTARKSFAKFNRSQASSWILTQMRSFHDPSSSSFHCQVSGKFICVNGFQAYHGITSSKWYSVRLSFLNGQTCFVHGNFAQDAPSPKTDLCRRWIDDLVFCLGDPSPTNDNVYLPMNIRTIDMFSTMTAFLIDELKVVDRELPGEDLFRKVFYTSASCFLLFIPAFLCFTDIYCLLYRFGVLIMVTSNFLRRPVLESATHAPF